MSVSPISKCALRSKILSLYYDQQKSINEIALEMGDGWTYLRVWRYLQKPTKNYQPKGLRRKYSKSKEIRLTTLLTDLGFSIRQIAKILNKSHNAVLQYKQSECTDNGGIVSLEIDILVDNLTDNYEVKEVLTKGAYLLYAFNETDKCFMVKPKGKGRVYFVKRDELIGNFALVFNGEKYKPC